MDRNYKECEIIFDLLPLYIDGKTGEESNSYISVHLAQCENCREVYQLMKEDYDGLNAGEESGKSRKNHKKISRVKAAVIFIFGVYVLVLCGCVCWLWHAVVLPVL